MQQKRFIKAGEALVIIVLIGTILRFTNLNWDSYQAFHPDERNIAWAVTRIRWFDQMNPKFFAYGGLPIYLYKILSDGVARATGDPTWMTEWGKIAVVGRFVSAALSSISILLISLVGSRYFSPAIGLVSAYFLAFSPWAIRQAHFATTETMLVFFLLVLLLRPRHVISGIIWGLAMAAKPTSLLFVLIAPIRARTLLAAAGTFLLLSPYTILDWAHFKESMDYETGVALGRFSVPYTLQFEGTIPYLYQLKTLAWQAGPVAILGLAGMAILAVYRKRISLLFLIFPTLYFLWSGSWHAKFARYTVPILPFLTLSAAYFMSRIVGSIGLPRGGSPKWGRICLFVGFVGLPALWALANWTIYLRPDTRIAAAGWIMENVPAGSKLLTEHWNDGLPLPHSRELLNVYDEDSQEKMATLAAQLNRADYLILTTRRVWGTMPRLTTRYPKTSLWYKALLGGELGYKEVARFTSYPSLLGITINDDAAEESIQVFDHPTVRIFKHASSP